MTRTSLREVTCSIARTVDVLSDAWAWLIVRDAFIGVCRFDDLQEDLGISRKVLAQRLNDLVEAAVLDKHQYADGPARFEYKLTDKGNDLVPILAALMGWGDRWEPTDGGPPLYIQHQQCSTNHVTVTCDDCGEPATADALTIRPGPGGSVRPGTAIIGKLIGAHDTVSQTTDLPGRSTVP